MPTDAYSVETARPEDLAILPEIEARASERFAAMSLPPDLPLRTLPFESLRPAQVEGRIFVARAADDRLMGFAIAEHFDGDALLDELDVLPSDGRQGVGRRLVEAVCDWGRDQGADRIVLSTFRDVPWNAPFYARLGFREIPRDAWTPPLQAMRDAEASLGLDLADRILMQRALRPT